jgi:UDP-glucose 4-epimerase
MNILITGNAGLIGSRLADWIIENTNHNVIGIDDLSGGYIENVHPNVVFYKRNLFKDDINDIFKNHSIDYVFHFAAYAAEGLSPFIRKFNYLSNTVSTANVINECINHSVKRLIFTSTMAVYGHGNPPFDEDDTPNPIDPYGIAKFACEMDIKVAGEQHGLDWCIIRPHNVYGIKQNIWDRYRNVLGIWMNQYINNKPFTIFGDGNQTRNFSYIDDCLEPLWKSAIQENCSKQIINLGGTKPYKIKEAAFILKEVIQSGDIKFLQARHEVLEAKPTYEKSEILLDYKDSTTLKNGLAEMWNWAKSQPKKTQASWESYEIEKGIYDFWKNK